MAGRSFLLDDRGGVSTDWVVLSAAILFLGIVVSVSVMENSSGYLMEELETLNEQYAQDAQDGVTVSQLDENLGTKR